MNTAVLWLNLHFLVGVKDDNVLARGNELAAGHVPAGRGEGVPAALLHHLRRHEALLHASGAPLKNVQVYMWLEMCSQIKRRLVK